MSDTEKIEAIQAHFRDGTYRFRYSGSWSLGGETARTQTIYGALIQKDANMTGWLNSFLLFYSLAGLDVHPPYGTEAYDATFGWSESDGSQMSIRMDGEWEWVRFMF